MTTDTLPPQSAGLLAALPLHLLLAAAIVAGGCADVLGTDDFAAAEQPAPDAHIEDQDPPDDDTTPQGPTQECTPVEVPGAHDWSARAGTAAPDRAAATAFDGAGNIIVVGSAGGDIDLGGGLVKGGGQQDALIAKLDPTGKNLWTVLLGDGADQQADAVAVDAEGSIYVVGSFAGQLTGAPQSLAALDTSGFVCKLSAEGEVAWCQRLGESDEQHANDVAVSAVDGSVWVTGDVLGTIDVGGVTDTSPGTTGAFVVAVDGDGAPLLVQVLRAAGGNAWGRSIALDSQGNPAVAGQFEGTLGDQTSQDKDGFVAMLKADGSSLWLKRIGGASIEDAVAVAVDPLDQVLVGGTSDSEIIDLPWVGQPLTPEGARSAFVLSFQADGKLRWAQPIASDGETHVNDLAIHDDGRVTLSGWFDGTLSGPGNGHETPEGANGFLISYDVTGGESWFILMGTSDPTKGAGVAIDSCGAVVAVSNYEMSTQVIGGTLFGGIGEQDMLIAKFQAN